MDKKIHNFKNHWFLSGILVAVLPLSLLTGAEAGTIFTADFGAGDGGFTVDTTEAYDGPWVYSSGAGSWGQNGQSAENSRPNTSMLNSPVISVTATGPVTLSFDHRYSFEGGFWDGGQVRLALNGGAYSTVLGTSFTQNGYNGAVLSGSASVLSDQVAFVEDGNADRTSIANLGNFNSGDSLSIQFIAGSDTNTNGPITPNWEIRQVTVTAVPEPSSVTLVALALGFVGLSVTRRRGTL